MQAIYGINKTQSLFMSQCISIYKDTHEIIAIKNKSQQNNKLFEDSECHKQCEDLNNFFSGV